MRKGWEYKKLGEVATFINGDRGKNYPSAKDFVESGVPFINAGHLNNGIISYDKMNYITINKYNSLGSGKIIKNDILFCLRGSLGKYAIVAEDSMGAIASSLVIIRPFQNADNRFIAYFLSSAKIKEYIAKNNNGSSQPNLSAKSVASFIISLPPLSSQLAIVSELDKINELIRLKKEQLKDFDNLAQSLFYEMFGDPVENEMGWEVKMLGEIGEFKNGLNFSKDENGHSIKFLGVSDFQNKKSIASDQLAYISLSERVQEDYLLKTGDIVFVRSNGKKELIGRSVKMYITEPTTYSGFCIRCRITDEKVDKDYIAILLKTPIIRQFMTNSGRGCNISNLNQKVLNSIPTILPPLSLQHLFAQRIEQIEREKSEVQKSIQDLETLLASRMQYWFE